VKFRVGVIGCGRITSTIDDELQKPRRGGIILPLRYAGGYAQVEETEIVAACDAIDEKLEEFQRRWNMPRGYRDFRQLIDEEQSEILNITTRPE